VLFRSREEKKHEEEVEETRTKRVAAEEELSEFMKMEDSFRRQEQKEISERDKNRNKARGRRRKTTKLRLAREAVEAEKRSESLKAKKKKKGPPRGVKIALKGPAIIAIDGRGNRRRLPRKSDAKTYADRWLLRRRWRILVWPCWVGIRSPRKRIQEQSGKDVDFRRKLFLRSSGQFKEGAVMKEGSDILSMLELGEPMKLEGSRKGVEESSMSWVQEITERPYFLRPELYASGRAKPETIRNWKIEEELSNPKADKGWRSVGESCRARHAVGEKGFKEARKKRTVEKPDVSYLTVSIDLPEEAVIVPERGRTLTEANPTFRYVTAEDVPIYGPVTENEHMEERKEEMLQRKEETRQKQLDEGKRQKEERKDFDPVSDQVSKEEEKGPIWNPLWDIWTPRWESMNIEHPRQVPVTVRFGFEFW
jgi:hypothetical protein